eukprot:TRINITY_DN81160_c0_g1_i1.p1 TRINITY_DN81160_c0_g1~~TRINITY_DN81160_c0_g1_i1.p1  ORF type:complete len:192 (-),score=29.08 TRINITY_DN81160_c0_g1_i1:122-697(-)
MLILLALMPAAGAGDPAGDPSCWTEGFSHAVCCRLDMGPEGNSACWDGVYTFQRCCGQDPSKPSGSKAGGGGQYGGEMPMHAPPATEMFKTHATTADGIPIRLMPQEYAILAFVAVIFLILLRKFVRCLPPVGMLGDGRRQDGGPDGLSDQDVAFSRQKRLQYFSWFSKLLSRRTQEEDSSNTRKQRLKIQ